MWIGREGLGGGWEMVRDEEKDAIHEITFMIL